MFRKQLNAYGAEPQIPQPINPESRVARFEPPVSDLMIKRLPMVLKILRAYTNFVTASSTAP